MENMLIPPKYTLTAKVSHYLSIIQANRDVISSLTIPLEIEQNIRRQSTLRSALYSAKIEGNTLELDDLTRGPSKDQKKIEVFNILKTINLIHQRPAKDLSIKDLLNLHKVIMEGLSSGENLGSFRRETNAIFNSAGIAIYMPPPPKQVQNLLQKLLNFVNSDKEQFVPIRACLAHYSFEKIHPFLDGNGRVGRIVLQSVLAKGGFGMKGLMALEELLDKRRSFYYKGLDDREKDVTDYLEFMLEIIAEASSKAKEEVLNKEDAKPEDYLLPRRAEILSIIKDHTTVNFDTLRRRFMKVNERTLRYDLKKLQDQGLIKKLGTTKGVYYQIKSQN